MNPILQLIIQVLNLGVNAAEQVTPNGLALTVEHDVAALLQIAKAASDAHERLTGQPIDLSLLQALPPI